MSLVPVYLCLADRPITKANSSKTLAFSPVRTPIAPPQAPQLPQCPAGRERYRDIDFSGAKRGAVVKPEPGKTTISIRLSNAVLQYFRDQADKAGGGNYQVRIDEALREHIRRRSGPRSSSGLARQRR